MATTASSTRWPRRSWADSSASPDRSGDAGGRLYAYNAKGSANVSDLAAGEQVTSISATKDGKGLWVFTNRGRVIVRGAAKHHGDMSGVTLNGPVLDSIVAPDGTGYYMVASDGGVFAFAAPFRGSMGSTKLNQPMAGMVPVLRGGLHEHEHDHHRAQSDDHDHDGFHYFQQVAASIQKYQSELESKDG